VDKVEGVDMVVLETFSHCMATGHGVSATLTGILEQQSEGLYYDIMHIVE